MESRKRRKTLPTSIRPGGNESTTHRSASPLNREEWPTAQLIEASQQIQSRLEELEQENNNLRQENYNLRQQLQSLRQSQQSDSNDNRKLVAEVQTLRQRHAALAEKRVNMDQRRTENTMSANRQSELEKEFKNGFMDGTRVDAIELIEKKLRKTPSQQLSDDDRLKASRLACYIFELSYECAVKAKNSFFSVYSSVLDTLVTDAPCIGSSDAGKYKFPEVTPAKRSKGVPQDCISEVMVLVKEAAGREDLNLEKLVKAAKKELKAKWKEQKKTGGILPIFDKSLKKELKGYIEYCIRFSWMAVTQVPPLEIDYKTRTFNPVYHRESQAFLSSAKHDASQGWVNAQEEKRIKCYLWPTLYDWEKRVIEKGEVVLTEQIFVGSYV
ncbi:uncharacterized protein LOC111339515 isoform X1 [Stylophora pistillata]|uniref:uncharacterized protein LOC111339515 isoform X1 n=1 Tax=Stylophora pistillata TaxID=50429 RepID=UPI000C03C473|nr:uncharacterized protein LOC111339515 isoform X1 [Stylophora pistillata]XP_022801926.1 uncharacterized protein LOC111339515 isoform X1 [Stylophora pistillata]